MKTAFIGIDLQNDFIKKDGALPVPNAENIVNNVNNLIAKAINTKHDLLLTCDLHDNDDEEFNIFPPHCIAESEGAFFITDLKGIALHYATSFSKSTHDIFDEKNGNSNFKEYLYNNKITTCIVFGVATDICVKAAVLGILKRGMQVILVEDACAGLDKTDEAIGEMVEEGAVLTSTEAICI